MFDFLGSGNDSKKKQELEENIAQIRKKVQQEQGRENRSRSRNRDSGLGGQGPDRSRDRKDTGPQQNPPEPPQQEEQTQDLEEIAYPEEPEPPEPSEQPSMPREPPQQEPPAERPPGQDQQSPQQDMTDPEPIRDEELSRMDTVDTAATPETERGPTPSEPAEPAVPEHDGSPVDDRQQLKEHISGEDSSQEDTADTHKPEEDTEQSSPPSPPSDGRASEGARLSREEVPKPPEVKDLDIPDIQKGPLFITMNKFKTALTTLSEMKELSGELEAQIGALENTLEEDIETENEFKKLLDDTIQGTEVIQDIVSPNSPD